MASDLKSLSIQDIVNINNITKPIAQCQQSAVNVA
jgi:hypothetical protein